MPVTQADVAKAANVSSTTVSRVVNNADDLFISEKTRARVLDVVHKMGYRPNHAARALATGRTNVVALWMPGLAASYFSQVIHCVQREIRQDGFEMIASEYGEQTGWMSGEMGASAWPVDGILIHNGGEWLRTVLKENPMGDKPLVSMGSSPAGVGDTVEISLRSATREAVRHLVDGGRRRVANLLSRATNCPGDQRRDAYAAVVEDAGLRPEFIVCDGATRSSAREALCDYVGRHGRPDGIFCANDDLAIGAYRGLRDLGIRIPDDVALVGCDGIEDTKYMDPPISTIVQPVEEMCSIAWQFLRERIEAPERELQKVVLKADLIVRESSLPNAS
jgi:DNA-binding LacI/PurR family transcriptional regulator